MKYNRIYKLVILFAGIMMLNSSCKKWLDVNTSPNDLSDDKMKVEYALTSSEYTVAYVLGNRYQELGGFLTQYWTQLPSATQYYDYDRYSLDGSDANREWAQLYAGALRDLKFIVERGTEDGDSNYVAIAKMLQAYTFQLVSDVHGDVPFSQALQAQSDIIAPTYDIQSLVYDGCIKLIDEGLATIGSENARVPGADDAIFHGDMSMWEKFGNTLKLKIALRQKHIRKSTTIAILNSLTGAPLLAEEENAAVPFTDALGNRNPLYTSILGLGVDNNVASKTITDVLNSWGDPRSFYFFTATASGVIGTPQGAAAAGGYPSNAPRATVPTTIIGATVPVVLISASESFFLQAEWMADSSLNPGGGGRAEFETAVAESMKFCQVDTSGLDLFNIAPYSWDSTTNHLELIYTHKWVSMCGIQNMESWIETRRTGVPALTPSLASTLAPGLLPQRIPYSSDEETANSNFPGQFPLTQKMWWAK